MKQLLTLLLAAITATAYADNNHKAEAKPKTVKPKLQQQPATTPANNTTNTDTAWHGAGTHYDYGQREYDPRLGRSMPIDPAKRPSPFGNNPYQNTTNNPIKAADIK